MKYDNHFLFSETYINDFAKNIVKSDTTEADNLFDSILSWYQEYKIAWEMYEDIVLDSLSFTKTVDGIYRVLSAGVGSPVAIAYLLSEDTDLNSTAKGKYYAVDAIRAARKNNVTWAIVTNGMEWRLYHTKEISPYEFYFAIDLTEDFADGKPSDNTRLFCKLFSGRAFLETDGALLIDTWKGASATAEETVEETLRKKAEDILKELCYGLKENMGQDTFTDNDRKRIYNDAIVLLYRMLFLGYAESRNLLPVVQNDPDYNDSFFKLCEAAKSYCLESKLLECGNEFDLWERLDTQLRIYVDKNYNGGLFSNEDKPILRTYRIANKHLAVCLLELSYIAGRKKEYKDRIEYKDLSVRNLGAIYEGLLEYQLFIAEETMVQRKSKDKVVYFKASEVQLTNADRNNLFRPGEIYLSQDALERKETGAYYTPEDVVEYIVDNTVGKKLQDLKTELEESTKGLRQELSYEPVAQNRIILQHEIDKKTVEFINEKVLGISVIDSAMGSGHFLVNATYKIANFIVELFQNDSWENSELDVSITTWKRKVVENCIYGIDINNLSVVLARLSLWLISASNDKALSFIDHHLKCGNSIIGTSIDKVELIDEDAPIFNVTKDTYMRNIVKKYQKIKGIGSDTKEDVEQQHKVYDEIQEELAVTKRKLDYFLASQYAGGISDETEFHSVLVNQDMGYFFDERFEGLFRYADNNQFFHWDLEFPEVYFNGGFDIAIGNPPYVECGAEPYKEVGLRTIEARNLYAYMLEKTISNAKAIYGFIVPLTAIYSQKTKSLQDFLRGWGDLYISNYGVRPSKIFRKAEQRVSILLGEKMDNPRIYSTDYQRWYTDERKHLFENLRYIDVTEIDIFQFIPKISYEVEKEILLKLKEQESTIGNYIKAKSCNEFVYHEAGRYWLKALDFYPIFKNEKTGSTKSVSYKSLALNEDVDKNLFILLINSHLFYWYWMVMTDARHFTKQNIVCFPISYEKYTSQMRNKAKGYCERLMSSYRSNSEILETNGVNGKTKLQVFHPSKNKVIIDEIEDLIGEIYGFTNDEVDFLRNYDLRFRMGEENE